MNPNRILILDRQRIDWKLQRMAFQIWEHNSGETAVTLIGIERGGAAVAGSLAERLRKISPLQVKVLTVKMDKRNPLSAPLQLTEDLNGQSVVLVDDVSNSGRTLLYALRPILDFQPSRILTAVLVERKHKSFPVSPDIVGHSVSTTLQENIVVVLEEDMVTAAYLE